MSGKGKGRGRKGKNKSREDEAVNAATASTTEAPGNHGSASSEDEKSGSYRALSGHVNPVSLRSGRQRKTKTPSRQDTRTTTSHQAAV